MHKTLLITGAAGFVGRHLLSAARSQGWHTKAVIRSGQAGEAVRSLADDIIIIDDITAVDDWTPYTTGCHAIIHLAARAHRVSEAPSTGTAAFQRTNVDATARLAEAAAATGVHRFIFISSSGVMGEHSKQPWTEDMAPVPESTYAASKWEAEQQLARIGKAQGLDYVILRPALVYGQGNPGNLARLIRLTSLGIPLPFKSIPNKRSLVDVAYLVTAILAALDAPSATNNTYFVADGHDISTSDIIRAFAQSAKKPPLLYPCPAVILKALFCMLGKSREYQKLTSNFQLDTSRLRHDLGLPANTDVIAKLSRVAYHQAGDTM